MRMLTLAAALLLAGCAQDADQTVSPMSFQATPAVASKTLSFDTIVPQITRAAQDMCVSDMPQNSRIKCDFKVVVTAQPMTQPFASSRLELDGTSVISINKAMLKRMKNNDELAFVIAHEAAHTLAGHHTKFQTKQLSGGFSLSKKAAPTHELEADALATILTLDTGFDPKRGVKILYRLGKAVQKGTNTHPGVVARTNIVDKTSELVAKGYSINIK